MSAITPPTTSDSATGTSPDKAFTIEQRGVQIVPLSERHGKPADLFWMWLGTSLNVFYVVTGALIVAIGLSFGQALIAIAVGSLSFFGVGLTSLQGPKTGTSTFMIGRAAFGPNGGRGVSLFNWCNFVGYEATGIVLIVLAVLELLSRAGVHATTGLKIGVVFAAAAVQFVLPLYGHQTIMVALRWLSFLLVPVFIVMAVLIAPKVHLSSTGHGTGWATVVLGATLVAAGGGLGWTTAASDYTRYLPPGTRPVRIFWAVSMAGMLASAALAVLGAAIASVVKSATDPIAGLPQAFPAWVLVPYLILFAATCLAVNTIDLYSSGLNLQSMGIRVKRWAAALIDLIICIGLTFFALFSSSFNRLYRAAPVAADRVLRAVARDLPDRLAAPPRPVPRPRPAEGRAGRPVLAQRRVPHPRRRRDARRHGRRPAVAGRRPHLCRAAVVPDRRVGLLDPARPRSRRHGVLAARPPHRPRRRRRHPRSRARAGSRTGRSRWIGTPPASTRGISCGTSPTRTPGTTWTSPSSSPATRAVKMPPGPCPGCRSGQSGDRCSSPRTAAPSRSGRSCSARDGPC